MDILKSKLKTLTIMFISSFVLVIFERIVTVKLLESNHKVTVLTLIILIIISTFISYIILTLYYESKNLKREEMHQKEIVAKEKIIKDNNSNKQTEGNRLFELSLGLHTFNEIRFPLMNKAAIEFNDIYSAVVLANLYISGLGDIIQQDYQKAIDLYNCVIDFDTTGLVNWSLGWMYENGLGCDVDLNQALLLYQKAAQKGYGKAYNSLGKFYQYGKILDKDDIKAGENYLKAAKKGDINGALNAGFLYAKKLAQPKRAEEQFKVAIELGSAVGKLHLGKLYLYHSDVFSNVTNQEIADLFTKAISSNYLSERQIACGYFGLANVLKRDSDVDVSPLDFETVQEKKKFCLIRAYNILFELNEKNELLKNGDDDAQKIWELLSSKIDFNDDIEL